VGKIQYIFSNLLEAVIMKKPESWDAKDFLFRSDLFCPICATPEDGTCQVLEEEGI
jgi:hypothetical protein